MFWSSLSGIFLCFGLVFFCIFCFGCLFVLTFSLFWNSVLFISVGILYLLSVVVVFRK